MDPEGNEFGVKRSPWQLPAGRDRLDSKDSNGSGGTPAPTKTPAYSSGEGDMLRFGKSGLRSMFLLEGPKAPDLVSTRRFLDSAELRVRLLVSGVARNSASIQWAQSLLPAYMATGVSKELDKYTAQVEAETRIPLADLLAGAPDAHSSNWITLRRVLMAGNKLDSMNTQLWMQVYVLPDNQSLLQKLNDEYVAEGVKLPDFRASLCSWREPEEKTEEEKTAEEKAAPSEKKTTAPAAAPAPAPITAVVPPGIKPGETFSVNGPPTVHKVKCPPGLKSGDTWQLADPTGKAIQVQVPPGVVEGQLFQVQVPQVLQVQCPADAAPGSTIVVNVQPPAPQPMMQCLCPADSKAGDAINVVIPDTGQTVVVQVPIGVLPGQPFAVQAPTAGSMPPAPPVAAPSSPAKSGPTTRLRQLKEEQSPPKAGYPQTGVPQPALHAAPPPLTDLLSGESPSTSPAAADKTPELSLLAVTNSAEANLPSDLFSSNATEGGVASSAGAKDPFDLTSLYAETSQKPVEAPMAITANGEPSTQASGDPTDKFAALMCLDGSADSPPRQRTLSANQMEGMADASDKSQGFQALQDSLLTDFSDSFKPS